MDLKKMSPENFFSLVRQPDNTLAVTNFTDRSLENLPRTETLFYEHSSEIILPPQAVCMTAVTQFNFQTSRLTLSDQIKKQDNSDVAAMLIESVLTGGVLEDGLPVLDGSGFEETAAFMSRLPNDEIALTTCPRSELDIENNFVKEIFNEDAGRLPTRILQAETALRGVVRFYLSENKFASADRLMMPVAFLIINEKGFAVGVWHPVWGLYFERAEPLQNDLDAYQPEFLDHALESALAAGYETAQAVGFQSLEKMVVSVPVRLMSLIEPRIEKISLLEETAIEILPESLENQISKGLIYAFTLDNPLPPADLNRDLYARLIDNSLEEERNRKAFAARHRARVMIAGTLPFVLLAAVLLGMLLHYARQSMMLAVRQQRATAEAARLKPITEARQTYIEHFKWRESYLRQILALRDRQTVSINFLPAVDEQTVNAADSRFAFSELTLQTDGQWTMRGVSETETGVTNFVRGLEESRSLQTSERLFATLFPEIRRGGVNPPSGANYKSSLTPPKGLFGWEVKGSYLPLAAIAPVKTKPGEKPTPAPATSPSTTTTTNPDANAVK